jgi:hypothetical protein
MEFTQVNTYGKHKKWKGRNNLEVGDIDKTKPKQLKQNRITNIPDYKTDCHDIDVPKLNRKFVSDRDTNPLQPIYKIETASRRHVMALGVIDGNLPKLSKSPVTRRKINDISDIAGTSPKDKGSMPNHKRDAHDRLALPPKSPVKEPIQDGERNIRSGAYQLMNNTENKQDQI